MNELGVLESCTEDIAALRREAEIADETPLFRLLTPAELDESRDVPYLIEDLIAPGDLVIIWGDAKAGKTFVTLDLLASMALGKPFIGKPTNRPVKVVYATAEGRRGIKHRIRGLAKQHGVSTLELNDKLRICLDLPNLHTREGVDAFFAECRAFGADVVVLDTFARASLGMDENAAKDMNPALAALDPYLKEGMTVILPHHANKAGDLRGSTGMHGAGDLFQQVKRTNDGRRSLVFHMAKDTTEFPEAYFKIVPAPWADSLKEVAVEWLERNPAKGSKPQQVRVTLRLSSSTCVKTAVAQAPEGTHRPAHSWRRESLPPLASPRARRWKSSRSLQMTIRVSAKVHALPETAKMPWFSGGMRRGAMSRDSALWLASKLTLALKCQTDSGRGQLGSVSFRFKLNLQHDHQPDPGFAPQPDPPSPLYRGRVGWDSIDD